MDKQLISIGISAYGICKAPSQIETVGLGSCVCVVIYSIYDNICGMIHIMMPENTNNNVQKPAKYADTGIALLIKELLQNGVRREAMRAKITGGACMFDIKYMSGDSSIGTRNINAVKNILKINKIEITAEDTGGEKSRTVRFDPKTKELLIKMPGKEAYFI